MKELVYWGIGKIGRQCIEYFSENVPTFIIDSNCPETEYNGIPIYRPEAVKNWNSLYIVITVLDSALIKQLLRQKNLEENVDFEDYKDFLGIQDEKADENIIRLENIVKKNKGLSNRILIFAPVFIARQTDILQNFLHQYAMHRNCVLISLWDVMSEEMASEKLGFPAFKMAEIAGWSSFDEQDLKNEELEITDLSDEDQKWIADLMYRKARHDNSDSLKYLQQQYQYLKSVIKIFQPKNMIIWGGWAYNSYIFGHLCKVYCIPCCYMEYGWIPGTYQFDPDGIAGQSVCANVPNPETDFNSSKINAIKDYIISKKTDSLLFKYNLEDEKKIVAIDHKKKTVFLVGMGDFQMRINSESDYWKKYVSSVVFSTEDAFEYIKNICAKHNWNFIFKPHPGFKTESSRIFNESSVYIFRDMQIDRLIESSDVVVSISSAVNYKVLLYNKPLVQIGVTCLSGKDCCYETDSKNHIEEMIVKALENGMTGQQNYNFNKHLDMLLSNYLWDDLSEKEIGYGLTFEKDFPFK